MTSKNKVLFSIIFSTFLIGCNKGYDNVKMPVVTVDEAKEVIASILKNHQDESFDIPTAFTINHEVDIYQKIFDYSGGNRDNKVLTNETIKFDCKNLKAYKKTTQHGEQIGRIQDHEIEIFMFYDEGKQILYNLKNTNGQKLRQEESMDKEGAKEAFLYSLVAGSYITEILDSSYLINFDSHIDTYKHNEEMVKDKEDQWYKYTFGSENKTSTFQDLLNFRLAVIEPSTGYEGYEDTNNNRIIKDNLLAYYKAVTHIKANNPNDSNEYVQIDRTRIKSYQYNVADITIPNIEDYKL